MTEYVRVADVETGHHLTITKARYDRKPSLWRELKQGATYADGSPRPPKHRINVKSATANDAGASNDGSEVEPAVD